MRAEPPVWRLKLAVRVLLEGGIIACPTEGVWGLSCLPDEERAVARILELKQRSWKKGLILVASKMEQLAPWLEGLSDTRLDELDSAWPGPVTYLVPDNGRTPRWITGEHDKVALRLSAHPVIRGICDSLAAPIVSTSANPAGRVPARSSLQVRRYFSSGIDYLVPGELGGQQGASEIRDLVSGTIIRSG